MSNHTHTQELIEHGFRPKTLNAYIIGLVGSLILTLLAFAAVYFRTYPTSATYIIVSVLAIIQLFVQSICFLRLNASTKGRWNLLAFLFVIMIISFIAGGSLWIMHHLNEHIGWS